MPLRRPHTRRVLCASLLLTGSLAFGISSAAGQKKSAPAKPAAHPAAPAAHPAAAGAAHPAAGGAAHPGATTTTSRTTTTTTSAHGMTTTTTAHTTTTSMGARPGGAMAGHPGGGVAGAHGSLAHAGPVGSHDRVGANGNVMRTRANGHPMDVHDARRGMDIHHNLAGGRRISVERADHSRLVYERGRGGYIAHPYMFHGHEYARRSYYYHGRAYNRFYNHYGYRGVYLDVYAPVHYYGVGFYGWAYNPWAVPVAYSWGWGAAPWYGYYGAYFTPYPVYAAPSLWLTDYLIATSLQDSYDAHVADQGQADAAGSAPPAPLTPETKALVAEEVKRQVSLENAEAQANAQHQEGEAASSSIARLLSDGQPHVFVAGKEMDLTDASGQECAVTDGDVLQLTAPPPADATAASLTVLSSKGGVECRNRSVVSVSFEDLQDMQNHMRETVDQGLEELQAKQGKGGLPAAPASALGPPVTALVAENAPPPEPGGAQELAQQDQQAAGAEQEVAGTLPPDGAGPAAAPMAAPAPAAPAAPVSIALGQTTAQVVGAMGQPSKILNLGPKTVYVYPDMKITFKQGKVADVE
ncbi:hypothetical protein FTO74_07055 [Granulicella sp. WH15]|uniref:hypothetical protein n=1 Tax=Granulicella sp. WH15 TaxID=2602070 RepID=UPI001366AF39|nr:hypothetical protein [Granulicella sp. WH15]QHN03153.1 hypothetical protein FTO74_07055 [Granulicella sp. WH15]